MIEHIPGMWADMVDRERAKRKKAEAELATAEDDKVTLFSEAVRLKNELAEAKRVLFTVASCWKCQSCCELAKKTLGVKSG